MTKNERFDWLRSLKVKQIRALACQRGLKNWKYAMPSDLVVALADFEDIEVPVEV